MDRAGPLIIMQPSRNLNCLRGTAQLGQVKEITLKNVGNWPWDYGDATKNRYSQSLEDILAPSSSQIPLRSPFSAGVSQLATFDDTGGYLANVERLQLGHNHQKVMPWTQKTMGQSEAPIVYINDQVFMEVQYLPPNMKYLPNEIVLDKFKMGPPIQSCNPQCSCWKIPSNQYSSWLNLKEYPSCPFTHSVLTHPPGGQDSLPPSLCGKRFKLPAYPKNLHMYIYIYTVYIDHM